MMLWWGHHCIMTKSNNSNCFCMLHIFEMHSVIYLVNRGFYPQQRLMFWEKNIKNRVLLGALLHFPTPPPPIVIDDSSWKNAAESFTVALTLTLGGVRKCNTPFLVSCLPSCITVRTLASYTIFPPKRLFTKILIWPS